MAELRIQPKKKAPSPWLLVALAALLLAASAYFYLRLDPADEPAPKQVEMGLPPVPADSLAQDSSGASTTPPPAPDSVAASAPASEASATLLQLRPQLTQLADRADLRDDAAVREQRDNFTSATARLADGDPQAGLRPGLVAAANLLSAVQQKAYPNLQAEVNALTLQASQLSGRDATPAEQAQNRAYFAQFSNLLNTMSYPAKDVL
ncbi:hypothetical protein E4631_04420 [Hymenobacter sp. UV11]|uniref:hypothetical protein n=1 Tax=Hymenobacter sp. UV11 TaxID=1849735 RepID=UPI00105EB530|nr:hypothetical protein [Hymenobacter sp. UV11]TDN35948.1 hypothetical protein A8B98_11065 [Hymenobacter sp. UV11]TFZ68239.1 hypothetical protein E4631_04420 [Hymenobacter sp. UV11]